MHVPLYCIGQTRIPGIIHYAFTEMSRTVVKFLNWRKNDFIFTLICYN